MKSYNWQLEREQVKKIAKLAGLQLSLKEVEKFKKQLSETLKYMKILSELETRTTWPTSQVSGLVNVFMEDKKRKSLSQEQALGQARLVKDGYFKVGKIF